MDIIAKAQSLNDNLAKKSVLVSRLKVSLRAQKWWGRDRAKTAQVRELLKTIEGRLHLQRDLARKLLDQLRVECVE